MISKKWVCSLELARRLRELGVKQDSDYYYFQTYKDIPNGLVENDGENCVDYPGAISAFHVGELGEMLPEGVEIFKENQLFYCVKETAFNTMESMGGVKKEADARAKMLIYLKDKKK